MNNIKKSLFIFFTLTACSKVHALMNQPHPELHAAVESGNEQAVVSLLAAGVDVNMRDMIRKTALHRAVETKNNALIPLLVTAGIDLDAADLWPETALEKGLNEDNFAAVHILLDAGACPNKLRDGEAPLAIALQKMDNAAENAERQSVFRGIIRALILAGADIPSLSSDHRRFITQTVQSENDRWLPDLLQKLVQSDSTIDQTWLNSSRFLEAFVTLGRAERRALIERLLEAKLIPADLIRLTAAFWCT